jgi:hypothetical protein
MTVINNKRQFFGMSWLICAKMSVLFEFYCFLKTMPDRNRATISTHFARVAITRAIQRGCNQAELLEAARLTPRLFEDDRTRITPTQLGALYRLIWQRLDDELMGFGVVAHRHGMFALMARHTTQCVDLRAALRYSVQFYNLMSGALRW